MQESKRIIAWQSAIYDDQQLPTWLKDCLVNNFALYAEDSLWFSPDGRAWEARPLGSI